ncbi:hypothetical protein DIPPA_63656 [Diplonema papillatum]|nr:hypothetical protein DIPPA_65175 [Diplonema papillatum]KAJ9436139.1 hypothetical protein DIPPA_65173 [Diplonema papillatum]KAJ9436793.1 hypothetical protein DIPPA_65178 [Diplonema papillatum]KAJ9439195.1 hypothetical protein DIPPA_63656 [Diplonema papillatum]
MLRGRSTSSPASEARSSSTLVKDVSVLLGGDEHATGPLRTTAVIFNLSCTTMGVGILSLATTFKYCGLILGPMLMVACAILTYISTVSMLKVTSLQRATGDPVSRMPTQEAMAEYTMGKKGRIWVQVVLILLCMGTLIAYQVSIKSLLWSGVKALIPSDTVDTLSDHHINDKVCMLIGLSCVSLPLCFLRSLNGLAFTSFLSCVSITYFVLISVVYLAVHPHTSNRDPCHEMIDSDGDSRNESMPYGGASLWPSGFGNMLQGIMIISVSYVMQLTVCPMMKELSRGQFHGPSDNPILAAQNQMKFATVVTMVIACFMYVASAGAGYMTWEELTTEPSTILACYPTSNAGIVPVYFGMTLVLLFAFPIITFTCRAAVINVFFPNLEGEVPFREFAIVTIGIVAPCTGVGLVATQLSGVLSIMSAVCTPSLCYLIPGMTYLGASKRENEYKNGVINVDDDENMPLRDAATSTALLQFIDDERAYVRDNPLLGKSLVGVGIVIQLLSIVAVIMSFA